MLVMRPEESSLQIPLDVRAVWEHPDHFDLAHILWMTWPDLNHVRFSLHEVTSIFRLDQKDDTATVLVRPHRWGSSPDARVVDVEVVRLQRGNLISRQTAILSPMQITARRLAEFCRIRDCSVFQCMAHLDGNPVEPDSELMLRNGDLITIVVSSEAKDPWSFHIASLPLHAHWDTRRWWSQEQTFLSEGTVLVFRDSTRATSDQGSLRIQVGKWYTWEILMRLVEKQWTDFRYVRLIKYDVHETWRMCPEFQANLHVVVFRSDQPQMLTRLVAVVCRDSVHERYQYWSQVVDVPMTELELFMLCGQLDSCKKNNVVCDSSWNGRPIRFAQHLLVEDGDLLILDVRQRQPFCDTIGEQELSPPQALAISLLQKRTRLTYVSGHAAPAKTWRKSSVLGLRPPGNPTYWFVNQLNTMSKYVHKGQDIYILDDVTRNLPKLSLMQCLGTEVPRSIATPMRREHARPDLSSQSVSLLRVELQASLGFTEADRPVWNIHSLDLEESIKTTACQLEVCSWNEDLLFAEALELYTDGSFDGHRAGWAVVILAHWGSHHAVLGTCSGAISEGSVTELGVEVPKLTAQVAEQVALV